MGLSPQCRNMRCDYCTDLHCLHSCHNSLGAEQPSLFDPPPDVPVRPYVQEGQPSAGWSGTDTSRDAEPVRAASQQAVLAYVKAQALAGATVAEVREATGLHHGIASGALSVLAQRGHLTMTERKRGRCRVYVAAPYAT